MTYIITTFGNDSSPALPDLDNNFKALAVLTPLACTSAGTNDLVLTQNTAGQAASIALAAYENGAQLSWIANATNTGPMTARLSALAILNVYKDSPAGPVLCEGGEVVSGNAATLRYDSALNSGSGGWHLFTTPAAFGATINPTFGRGLFATGIQLGSTLSPTLTSLSTRLATLTYTSLVPNSSQDQTATLTSVTSGDAIMLGLPSLASLGLSFFAWVPATGTIAVRANNITAASTITPGAMTVRITAMRMA